MFKMFEFILRVTTLNPLYIIINNTLMKVISKQKLKNGIALHGIA